MQKLGTVVILPLLLLTLQQISFARAQGCPEFQKAVEAAMAASSEVEAQLARFKSTSQAPKADAGVCNAAKRLKVNAATAVKLAKANCDPNKLADDLATLAQGAESEIKLFCGHAVRQSRSPSEIEERDEPRHSSRKRRMVNPETASQSDSSTSEKSSSRAAGCKRIVGTWIWVGGVEDVFKSDGTYSYRGMVNGVGKWTCRHGNQYIFRSETGVEDRLVMSEDGNTMTGTSSFTGFLISFTVNRKR